jgi:hypothetical protein
MAAIYEKNPLPYEGKFSYGAVGLSHCRRWAELDKEQAQEAEALAALHAGAAAQAEQKSTDKQETSTPAAEGLCCNCCAGMKHVCKQGAGATRQQTFASVGK